MGPPRTGVTAPSAFPSAEGDTTAPSARPLARPPPASRAPPAPGSGRPAARLTLIPVIAVGAIRVVPAEFLRAPDLRRHTAVPLVFLIPAPGRLTTVLVGAA